MLQTITQITNITVGMVFHSADLFAYARLGYIKFSRLMNERMRLHLIMTVLINLFSLIKNINLAQHRAMHFRCGKLFIIICAGETERESSAFDWSFALKC